MGRNLLATVVLLLGVATGLASETETPASYAAAADAVTPSLVRVEYTLRYDKGEPPQAAGRVRGGFPIPGGDRLDAEAAVLEERPLVLEGFLIGPTQVVSPDPMIHPRFVEAVAVRFADEVVPAKPAAYAKDHIAVLLELERPLKGAKPLRFDGSKAPPYLAVTYGEVGGSWTAAVQSLPTALGVDAQGRRFSPAPLYAVVVDEAGTPVGLAMDGRLPADDSWKGSPCQWSLDSAEAMGRMLEELEKRAAGGVWLVSLYFRSPRKESGRSFFGSREESGTTEMHTTGLLIGDRRLLVLANLNPKLTARLERIVVRPPAGEPLAAAFDGSLKDYGGLLATLEKPAGTPLAFSANPILDSRSVLLPAAWVRVYGEQQVVDFGHRRIKDFRIGWHGEVYPDMLGQEEGLTLFDADGGLLAVSIAPRERVSARDRWSSEQPVLTAAANLKEVLDDLPNHVDASNIPLTEADESRLAWLGLELQPLNQQLARANRVADQTRDGRTGAIVSYVYPESPAAQAGIEPGDVLLRLHVEGEPKPLEIELGREADVEPFPWEQLDNVPEQYFDRIPQPWPPAENTFTRALTDLGFGTKFQAEFFRDGRILAKSFEVAASPPYYESAPRTENKSLGLTVRDLTYEVRRYFQRKPEEPGVIVSKIEPGSKAAVAGVKPYEIITHVNDKPILNVKDFEGAVAGQEELRLSIKRMMRGRVVKINMAAPAPAPAPEEEKPIREVEPEEGP